MHLRMDRFLNAIYMWCMARVETEKQDRFLFQLNDPPPDMRPTEMVVAAEMDAFASFAGAFGVSAPAGG